MFIIGYLIYLAYAKKHGWDSSYGAYLRWLRSSGTLDKVQDQINDSAFADGSSGLSTIGTAINSGYQGISAAANGEDPISAAEENFANGNSGSAFDVSTLLGGSQMSPEELRSILEDQRKYGESHE